MFGLAGAASDAQMRPAPFREGTFVVSVRGEEPVVTRELHVVGEVVVRKRAASQEQTVVERVRREQVEVEEQRNAPTKGAGR
jgi:stress response protein YsnF